jgi:CheY-like chemotaxis protein
MMPSPAAAAGHASLTALIVDDDDDMRLLIRAHLSRAGLRVVEEAIDGPTALDIVSRLDPPPVPTVIVLDNRMPTMTGLEVAARVLASVPGQRIVLFTAYLTGEIEAEAARLGISACVRKSDIARLPAVISAVATA